MKKGGVTGMSIFLIVLVVGIAFVAIYFLPGLTGFTILPGATQTNIGDASTAYPKAYTGTHSSLDSKTEANVSWYIWNADGTLISTASQNPAIATFVGDTLTYCVDGTTSFYGEPNCFTDEIDSAVKHSETLAWDVSEETDLTTTCYDSTGSVALTADDDDENENDYTLTMGASATESIYCKVKNDVVDENFRLGGLCTFANNYTDYFIPLGSEWTQIPVPDQLDGASIVIEDDASTNHTISGWEKCYVLNTPVMLTEWQELKFQFELKTKTTDPASIGGNIVSVMWIDAGNFYASDGNMKFDIVDDTTTEAIDTIGMAEAYTSPNGLTGGATIEII